MIDEYPEQSPTPRQFQVGELWAMGRNTSAIANALSIGKRTVESHVLGFYAATGCEARSDVFDWFCKNVWKVNLGNTDYSPKNTIIEDPTWGLVSGEGFTLTARQNEFNGINIIIV